jgi:quaternary ammonium compound-resistance protein SugE
MAWFALLLAGAFEISWSVGLKWAVKHPRYWPLLLVFVLSIFSFLFLARAMRDLPLGTSYVIWTGIGSVGAAVFGIVLYHEAANPLRLACMALVVVGIMGLKYTTHDDVPPNALPGAAARSHTE